MRYAIYGGTFDPLHIGHVTLADHAVRECSIDKLIFMPDHISPFKQDQQVTDSRDRCAMIERALPYNRAFRMSTYEVRRDGPSYTIETLRHWRGTLQGELCFVLGFDSAVQVDTWYCGEEILREYPLITALRPGTDSDSGLARIEEFRKTYNTDITVMNMLPVDVSSTEIRRRAAEGLSLEGLVLPEIEEYIIEHNLYRQRGS